MRNILFTTAFILGGLISSMAQNAPLTDYPGKFNFPEGSAVPWVVVKLAQDSSTLVSESPNGMASLVRIEADKFSIVEYNGVAEFKRNAEGKVTSIKVLVMGLEMEGSKEESGFLPYYRRMLFQSY